ncbi:protein kinase [Streptomyces sp. M41]|uniref:serine/threonine-protein kinase n=1 Tax=Streptomyces sp. M41 TaxID=3059412 RepID=UPI00374D48D9
MLTAGRYRLLESIGRGGMGEVWRAYDEALARHVAVKLLLPQDSDPTAVSRFRLEARTAARIDHPNVVSVRDFGEYDNRLFLVMELVAGDSLATTLVRSGPLPAERVARIAAEAAAGLAAAHRQGIVHRDIKPGNLLLDADGTLKIGDFGIARFMDDPGAALTATGQIVGTSLYLAPERALGKPAGPASDVYALGCVLYQLLTGRPPFQADTAVAILHQHLDAVPVPPRELGVPSLPPAFESYLLSLLAKEPEQRPTAQQAADWFAGGAWQGRPEPLPDAAPPGRRRTAAPASAPGSQQVGETSSPTTYMLPSARGTSSPAAPARGRRPAGSRRVVVTAAAAVLFAAAMLLGMLWFSPDNTGAEGTDFEAPPGASASPAADTATASATSLEPTGPSSTASPVPAARTGAPQDEQANEQREQEREQQREQAKREQERAEERERRREQERRQELQRELDQQRQAQQDDDDDGGGGEDDD